MDLIILFIISGVISTGESKLDWVIQVCISGQSYNISKSTCGISEESSSHGGGIWFAEPLKIERACFSPGLWAVYKEWCQENPAIWLTGSTSKAPGCMERKLLEKVAGIVFLGSETTGTSLSTAKQKLFFESLEPGKQNLVFLESELNILTWGSASAGPSYTFRQDFEDENAEACLIGGRNSFFRKYKLNITTGKQVALSLHPGNCSMNATRVPAGSGPKILHASAHLSRKENSLLNCNDLRKCTKKDKCPSPRSAESILRDVNEQSARLALKFQAHFFMNLSLPTSLEQWKLLEMSKALFRTVCTNEIVPAFFLDSMLIFGQFLISESAQLYPRPQMPKGTFNRIQNVLHNCMASTKPFEFEALETCSNNSRILIQVKYLNGTKGQAPHDLPEDLQNNPDVYDLIIELTWKLFLFAHYTCANHFRQVPSDLSAFYAAWHELITRDLQERWTNPGKSYKMLELIFKNTDLQLVIRNIDYCVGAARAQSVYYGWLKRPFQVKGNRKLIVTKDLIWNGNAYCMDHYAYPAKRLGYPIEQCGVTWITGD